MATDSAQDAGAESGAGEGGGGGLRAETNRARVRRLLFGPLGFRHPKAVAAADGQAILDRIADEVAYLSDAELEVLARMVRPHGGGAARCFWPDRATFIAYAHLVRPLPLEEDPKLLSWFASVEGPAMIAAGTLVETFEYITRHRVPPHTPQGRNWVAGKAAMNARELTLIEDRLRLGYEVDPRRLDWAARYRAERDRLAGLVERLRSARGVAA